MSQSNDDASKRGTPRRKIIRVATGVFDGPHSPVQCVLLDLSQTGARLSLPDPERLPDRFVLVVEAVRLERGCEVVRRDGETIGIRFID